MLFLGTYLGTRGGGDGKLVQAGIVFLRTVVLGVGPKLWERLQEVGGTFPRP